MIKNQLLIGLALIVGVGVGYCVKNGSAPTTEPEAAGYQQKSKIVDGPDVRKMQQEVVKTIVVTNVITITNSVAGNRGPGPGRGNPREWLENLKKTDPERYIQTTNRFAQFRQQRLERQQAKLDFLASVDTSKMSASARENHENLQDLIVKREELMEKLHDQNLSDAERKEVFDQMRELHDQLRKANETERNNLFEETARTLGFEGDDVKEIVGTLNEVVESTQDRGFGPPPGGGHPPQGAQGGRMRGGNR